MSEACRWGILGAAQIARKNWKAIRNSGNGTLVAVASRSQEKAAAYVQELQALCPFETTPASLTYEELLARPDLDAVYIPLPTGLRKEWVLRAAAAGKHVLSEKPCAPNAADLQEILSACRKHRVQFMDGVMFMHSRRLQALRSTLDDGLSVGAIRRIASQFSFLASEDFTQNNIRANTGLEPLGCLGDLGWYSVRFILWALHGELPSQVIGRRLGPTASEFSLPPLEFSAELLFASGASASLYCSFAAENQQWVIVSGDRGYLQVSDFVLPRYGAAAGFDVVNDVFDQDGCDFRWCERTRRVAVPEYSNSHPNSQETNMFRTFSQNVIDGTVDESWGAIALQTQQVVDACMESARNGSRPVCLSSHEAANRSSS